MNRMKEFLVILKRNVLSPIVIAIFVLASILLILGEARDAWFISSVILFNTILAVIQEIRARRALKKLELMSAPHARLYKNDGTTKDVLFSELKVGDEIELQLGDEIPADGQMLTSNGLETDESMMTGESAPVGKATGSVAYAGSAVVAGGGRMHVTAVGVDTKVGAMASVLKRYEPEITPIQHSIAHAITYLTYGALGLAALILIMYLLSGQDAIKIFKTITSAAVTVVPEGLLLASSLLLAYGSVRLAQAKVLPQKLAAIEAMALIDILCVDKTGTLTSDKISFEKLQIFNKSAFPVEALTGIVSRETSSGSKTGIAIMNSTVVPKQYEIIQNLAFSSKRKLSGVRVKYDGKTYSVLMGAPEYVSAYAPVSDDKMALIHELTGDGKRVLLVASIDDTDVSLKDIHEKSGKALGIVILSNELRDGVKQTVAYFQKSGVSLRVISGDNPDTVSYVAHQAGIINHEQILTGQDLAAISDEDWDNKVLNTVIFARILPDQKERLVDTFRRLGNFTGMVGDGINDALAIKKSDLGVAMYDGAVATRRVADIVLLNNSFNSLPLGMKLGNRIMQAIELIATLFFHKITYSVVLLLSTLVMGITYPFAPRHITFMNMFLVTFPTVMWTLFSPVPGHRVSPKRFWRDTLFAVMPIAVLSGIVVTISYAFLNSIHPDDAQGVVTTTVIIATFFGVYLVFLVPRMFNLTNNRDTKLARLLYILAVAFVVMFSFGIGFMRDFFDFTTPAWQNTLPLLALIICVAIFQWKIATKAGDKFRKHN